MSEDEAFIAELLQHRGHSTVKEAVEEALREYVGDGECADELILDTFVREVAAKAWDEGRRAEARSWGHVFDGHPVAEGEMCGECKVQNPYEGGAS